MSNLPYIERGGPSSYHQVVLSPQLTLHFSYGTLVVIQLQGISFMLDEYVGYSKTTSKHIAQAYLPNKVEVNRELFKEIILLCIPQPLPQTSGWFLGRLRRGMISTSH